MKFVTFIILFALSAQVFASPFLDDSDHEKIDDTYYFISEFKHLPVTFVGDCGKGIQALNRVEALDKISNPQLRKIIQRHLRNDTEFTGMSFNYQNNTHYMNIEDRRFVAENCQKPTEKHVFIDGYRIDLQSENRYSQQYLIIKVTE